MSQDPHKSEHNWQYMSSSFNQYTGVMELYFICVCGEGKTVIRK